MTKWHNPWKQKHRVRGFWPQSFTSQWVCGKIETNEELLNTIPVLIWDVSIDCWLTAASLSEVYPDELDHVGLEEVHVPPGLLLHLGEGAGAQVEPGAGAAVHRLLGDPAIRHAALHRSLPRRNIQNWNIQNIQKLGNLRNLEKRSIRKQ